MENNTNELKAEAQTGSPIIINNQTESIEVTKNTKGYNWSVKILGTDLDRLQTITNALELRYKSNQ